MTNGQDQRVWSFPDGMIDPEDSIKGFRVEANDEDAGKVSWASYAPGESYLVIAVSHHLRKAHHVVPAGVVTRISVDDRTVWLRLSRAEIEELPEHRDQAAPLEPWMVEAVDRARARLGFGGDIF
jgi:hypothetical protein